MLYFFWLLVFSAALVGPVLGVGEIFLFRILWPLFLILFCLMFLKNKIIETPKLRIFKLLLGTFGFWIIYGFLISIFSKESIVSFIYVFYLCINFSLIFFTILYINNLKKIKALLSIVFFYYLIVLIVSIWEISTGNHLSISSINELSIELPYVRFIPTALFVNTNDLATVLVLYFPFVLYYLKISISPKYKTVKYIVIFLYIFVLFFTSSRANWMSAVLQLFLFLLLLHKFNKKAVLIVSGLVSIIVIILLNHKALVFINILDQISNIAGDDVRFNLLRNGFLMLKDSYFIGVGGGNIEYSMPLYNKYFNTQFITNIHNFWAEVLVSYGILNFIFFTIFFIYAGFSLFEVIKILHGEKRDLAICSFVSIVSFILSSMSSSSISKFYPIWAYFGILFAVHNVLNINLIGKEANENTYFNFAK